MKQKTYFLNLMLVVVLTLAMAAMVLLRTFGPAMVLPKWSIPNMVLLSLVALLLDHYLAPGACRCYICIPLFAVLSFGILPLAAGVVSLAQCWKIALIGGAVFTLVTWLFSSIQDRLSTGPSAKLAPVISAFGLYLAFQAFAGILL